ncbi:MAG: glycosyltransferase family 4 protein [Halobacteriovoraceae bacterium]|jgi:glycosyltransferase involved in cell wall biosynthesis|nr:glycosyltransferase family 4 protein [Halobacteriovoraceae bacterium]
MKIAIFLLNSGRGSGELARMQARFLIEAGHEVWFSHPYVGEGVAGATNVDVLLETEIIPVHEYLPAANKNQKAVSTMQYEEAMAYLPAYEKAMESYIEEVDIVLTHHANLSAVVTHNVCQKHNKPFVIYTHGTGIEPRHHGGYNDQVWQKIEAALIAANGLLVTTEYVRDELVMNIVDVPKGKFAVVPCGVDLVDFRPDNVKGISEKYNLPAQYVICPGALLKVKGPQNVVEASKVYCHLAETIFIGGGDMQDELQAALGDRGRVLGFVSSDDKAKLINAATVLTAAPEKKEHFGIIYAEALAGGTPSVAYEGGGVPAVISPDTGILVERSPEKLGQGILQLLENPDKRRVMGLEARLRAERLFSYPQLITELVNWLRGHI